MSDKEPNIFFNRVASSLPPRRLLLYLSALIPASLLLIAGSIPLAQTSKSKKAKAGTTKAVTDLTADTNAFAKKYCVACHSGTAPTAGFLISPEKNGASILKNRVIWERVSTNVADAHMPPASMPQPTPAERLKIVSYLDGLITKADCQLNDPGHITLRRLNRDEYNNTMRDLCGVDLHPANEFPNDDVGYGFDNIGDVLSISPLLMEKYLSAAEKVVRAATVSPETNNKVTHIDGSKMTGDGGTFGAAGKMLSTEGEAKFDFQADHPGTYILRVRAFQQQGGNDPAKMEFRIDGQPALTFEIKALERNPENYELKVPFTKGDHKIGLAFTNDFYDAEEKNPRKRDRNLIISSAEILPPAGMPDTLPETHKKLIFCKPGGSLTEEAAAKNVLTSFTTRAYRRPAKPEEIARLMHYVQLNRKEGESFEHGIQLAMQAVMVSPNFLFRVELDQKPNDIKATRTLNDYEIASRLSYFLWSTMPDAELFSIAAKGTLHTPKVLAAQAKRMLKDPRSRSLTDNFAGQWLQLRNLPGLSPDTARFPEFNDKLRTSMRTETEMFFDSIVREDRSILGFLDSNYTFLNEPLAKFYGITGVQGDNFRRVSLAGNTQRGGILSQASILTVTSNPTRTSPVKRGKWVLENLFGAPPPPPPPNVGKLADDKKEPLKGTLRQRMEQHRKDPGCASCHAKMDPIGFGLENYDAIGKWRTVDGDSQVDSSGALPGGVKFNGPAELKTILKGKKAQFTHCFVEKMMIYGLGRGLENTDRCHVNDIVSEVANNDYRLSSVVVAVVLSDPFLKRRGDGGLK